MPADLPVAAPDPASRLAEWADDAAHIVQSVRSHEPTYPNPAALRRDVRALLAERQQDKERIERLETARLSRRARRMADRIAFVPPWRFWPRSWFGYFWPRRITMAHNPPVYRWLWWNFGGSHD